jgi:hypothetical protein
MAPPMGECSGKNLKRELADFERWEMVKKP